MPELPNQRYLRRRHIVTTYGMTNEEFSKLVRASVLKPYYLAGEGRAWFRRDEVLQAEEDGKIFRTEKKISKPANKVTHEKDE